ncbi:hypothetical protein FP66_15955 [Halomonas salina]|uniref:DUF6418 domain-containing protein n=2 Tax=Halomonas salina TaxID=42565 RepID=A0ABR4WWL0_9GAMM|nr:hypothetical protein FP66_15955 [Halomonas salina]
MTGVIFSYRAIDAVKLRFFSFPSVMRMGLEQLIRAVALLMIAVLVSIAMLYGTPSEHGVHRMDYWAYYAPTWGGAVAYWIIQLSFPLGYIYAHRKRKIDIAIFFLILMVSVYMGTRFTGLVLACFFFFLPIALLEAKKPLSVFFSWRGAMVLVLLLLLLVTALLASYGTSLSRAVEMVLARAGVQAQMWWALNDAVGASLMPIGDILGHYFGFGTEKQDSGVYYLMKQVAPMDVVNYRIETGSAFTMSGVFNNVHFFGYALGGLVNVLYGAVFGVSCGLLKKALESRNLIVSLFAFKLMYKLMVVLLTGSTDQVFTLGNVVFFLIIIAFLRLSVSRYEYQCR